MLLLILVITIAAVDALNPSTVLPALLYAVGRHARRDVALFVSGVFAVSTIGGLVLVFGPGRGLLRSISSPSKHTVRLVEAGAGALLVAVAVFLWLTRAAFARRLARERVGRRNSAFLLGAGIMATELPTAIPYFGALIAITEGEHHALASFVLVLVYNLVFVAPLLALLGIVLVAGARGAAAATRIREVLVRHGSTVTPVLLGGLGVALLLAALL